MKRLPRLLAGCLLAGLVSACGSPRTDTTVLNFRDNAGAYVLVYSTDLEMRTVFEDRLVADLAAREIAANASHLDLPDVRKGTRDSLLAAARRHHNMFILMVEEVGHDESGIVPTRGRITHEHPTLKEFYAHSLPADHEHDDATQVFVEVSAFLVQEDHARLVWSGTAWSFQADGESGRIPGLSTIIADAIEKARDDYLGGD
ncbi:hypothetical protein [Elongatibacter sediminis]|uniref:DUF4136 domain-containing protein n=1 Tax=Elongatibacter sediminis TaxID=3119006 RepID=A0AAW9RBX8_9GAMM